MTKGSPRTDRYSPSRCSAPEGRHTPPLRTLSQRLLAAGLLLLLPALAASAQELRNGYFVHEFWAPVEATPGAPLVSPGSPTHSTPPPGAPVPTTPTKQILREAQYVYSGMIYGFSFTYIPSDATRRIAGSFEIKPIAQIKWGDPHLKVLDSRLQKARLVARVLYTLEPFQRRWLQGWDSNVYPSATGRGSSRYFVGYEEKMVSYKEAMKEAIRNYLRQRIYNKPREVTGEFVLRGSPYTVIDAGKYVTTLSMKLRIEHVQPYSVY